MEKWNTVDNWLLVAAAYVAVLSLVRLMLAKRDTLARELDRQIAQERERLAAEQAKAEKAKKAAAVKAPPAPGRRAA